MRRAQNANKPQCTTYMGWVQAIHIHTHMVLGQVLHDRFMGPSHDSDAYVPDQTLALFHFQFRTQPVVQRIVI